MYAHLVNMQNSCKLSMVCFVCSFLQLLLFFVVAGTIINIDCIDWLSPSFTKQSI